MYTGAVESEREFLVDLWKSHNISMRDGEEAFIRKCPKCRVGNVIAHCTQGIENGYKFWKWQHRCDACGEEFGIARMNSDIFFNTPFEMLDQIETPFGNVTVKRNGKPIHFRCRNEKYEDTEDAQDKSVLMKIIDIDMSECKQGDILFCGFDDEILECNDSDERSVIYSCENGTFLLGLCAYEPDELDIDDYCYRLDDYCKKGFGYKIISDPKSFDADEFYQSKITSLAVTWLRKEDHDNPNTEIFMLLTALIG